MVVDGGSTDDTAAVVGGRSDVTLITDVGEQWWTGATWLGIDHALRAGGPDDFVLLLNNDTTFGPEMIDVLVRESLEHDAAVAPIVVDDGDGTVVAAGTTVDWRRFRMMHRKTAPTEPATWPTDLFEGRGTLVPMHMIRAARQRGQGAPAALCSGLRVQPETEASWLSTLDDEPNHGAGAPRRDGAAQVRRADHAEATLVRGDEQALLPELRDPVHVHRSCRS